MQHKVLQQFVGKPCSIFVEPNARQLNEKQAINYYLGVVESVDADGVLMRHPGTGCRNFFFMRYVVGLCEEEILDPNNPDDAKVIEQYKKQVDKEEAKQPAPPQMPRPPMPPMPAQPPKEDLHQQQVGDSPFVELNAIQELAKRAKSNIKK